MKLYWAEKIDEPGVCIIAAEIANTNFMTHNNPTFWENATLLCWEYLDWTTDGALFRQYKLRECPEGTPLSNKEIEAH